MKININKKNVGYRIRNIRLNKGYTLERFGELFGASKGNVQSWEKGLTLPNKARIKQIADIGNITVNELLYGSLYEVFENNKLQLSEKLLIPFFVREKFLNYLKDNNIYTVDLFPNIDIFFTAYENFKKENEEYYKLPTLKNAIKNKHINEDFGKLENKDINTEIMEFLKGKQSFSAKDEKMGAILNTVLFKTSFKIEIPTNELSKTIKNKLTEYIYIHNLTTEEAIINILEEYFKEKEE